MADDPRTLRHDLEKLSWAVKLLADALTAQGVKVATALDRLNARTQRAGASLTNIAVGVTDVTITWPNGWPDAAYLVAPMIISGGAALGTLYATVKSGTKTASDVVITVANTGAAPVAAAALDVLGIRT